jgi:hypothetical protein
MSDDELRDDELWELATLMALTMPLESPQEAAFRRRVEQRQVEWERALAPVMRALVHKIEEAEVDGDKPMEGA